MGRLRVVMRWLLGGLMIAAGVNHFVDPDFYVRIMPPYLPWHRELVLVSGVFEVVLGLLVLEPRTRRLAGWGLIALFVAVFPANVHMAMNPELYPEAPPAVWYARLPLQGVFILWAYWAAGLGRRETPSRPPTR
ncbi:MAG: DoxX family protein [Gemmataceae bacterium]|nr:DoxX family protein [Gemmataceae bacterium]